MEKIKEVATKIYNNSLDMDFMDYLENIADDINCAIDKLEKIVKDNNGDTDWELLENLSFEELMEFR